MFGQYSFSDHMTPDRFAKLEPHLQTEALLLATETGLPLPAVAASIAISNETARRLMTQRHAYASANAPAMWTEPDSLADVGSNKMKVLFALIEAGGEVKASLSLDDIAHFAEISARSAPRAMRDLATAGFVVCLKRGAPNAPAVYRVTADGIEASRNARGAR
ncbi:hypothetical protein [Mycoplana rhizolycopersici]|uniref:Transcriptional regulator n=1 Tax=Mycoplana rhizolycopersici TaxID=2746702 RepID=A0ABX2QDI2_9HYPH|nr:hypothetical protein [Rhizobium rhizolycopersici]NVP54479.1 hypothetical protein [Rhizobium rhizolycopersici]